MQNWSKYLPPPFLKRPKDVADGWVNVEAEGAARPAGVGEANA